MHSQLRQKAIDLRVAEDLSYGAIHKKLGVAKSTLSYWLKEYPLSRERILELRKLGWTKGEASREKFRATMRERERQRLREFTINMQKRCQNCQKKHFLLQD